MTRTSLPTPEDLVTADQFSALLAEQLGGRRAGEHQPGGENGDRGKAHHVPSRHQMFWLTYLSMSSVAEIIFELTS